MMAMSELASEVRACSYEQLSRADWGARALYELVARSNVASNAENRVMIECAWGCGPTKARGSMVAAAISGGYLTRGMRCCDFKCKCASMLIVFVSIQVVRLFILRIIVSRSRLYNCNIIQTNDNAALSNSTV